MSWFFTFGTNHETASGESLGGRYVVINDTQEDAIGMMNAARGDKWSFCYPVSELETMVNEYGLTEVSLQEITLPKSKKVTSMKMPFSGCESRDLWMALEWICEQQKKHGLGVEAFDCILHGFSRNRNIRENCVFAANEWDLDYPDFGA